MNKKALLIAGITGIFLIVCIIWTVIVFRKPKEQRVFIIQDNKVIYDIDLASAENQEIRIECESGYNIVKIYEHEIFVSEADCADKTCVNTGILCAEGLPIVCLPHKLIIRFAEEGEQP